MPLHKIEFRDTEIQYLVSEYGIPISHGYDLDVPLEISNINDPNDVHAAVGRAQLATIDQITQAVKARNSMHIAIAEYSWLIKEARRILYQLLDAKIGSTTIHSGVCGALGSKTSYRVSDWCQILAYEFGVTHTLGDPYEKPRFVDCPYVMTVRRKSFIKHLIRRLNKLALDPETIAMLPKE